MTRRNATIFRAGCASGNFLLWVAGEPVTACDQQQEQLERSEVLTSGEEGRISGNSVEGAKTPAVNRVHRSLVINIAENGRSGQAGGHLTRLQQKIKKSETSGHCTVCGLWCHKDCTAILRDFLKVAGGAKEEYRTGLLGM